MQKRFESEVIWAGARKLGLSNQVLKKSINKKIKLPKPKFS